MTSTAAATVAATAAPYAAAPLLHKKSTVKNKHGSDSSSDVGVAVNSSISYFAYHARPRCEALHFGPEIQ